MKPVLFALALFGACVSTPTVAETVQHFAALPHQESSHQLNRRSKMGLICRSTRRRTETCSLDGSRFYKIGDLCFCLLSLEETGNLLLYFPGRVVEQ